MHNGQKTVYNKPKRQKNKPIHAPLGAEPVLQDIRSNVHLPLNSKQHQIGVLYFSLIFGYEFLLDND
uniref:Uncharacterized protein n=1 Tax=Romanomermis culicivorax TaxID=13658 RepID=A0A915J9B5_ROMCU